MVVDWKGTGRKSYNYPELHAQKSNSRISLEWLRLDGETYYKLFAVRNDAKRIILEFRISDNMWMDVEPKFYGDF